MVNSAHVLRESSGINTVLMLQGKTDGADSRGWKRRKLDWWHWM